LVKVQSVSDSISRGCRTLSTNSIGHQEIGLRDPLFTSTSVHLPFSESRPSLLVIKSGLANPVADVAFSSTLARFTVHVSLSTSTLARRRLLLPVNLEPFIVELLSNCAYSTYYFVAELMPVCSSSVTWSVYGTVRPHRIQSFYR
jgi:hypothetical protein